MDDFDLYGRIILKFILKKEFRGVWTVIVWTIIVWNVTVWTVIVWLRIGIVRAALKR